VIGRASVAVNLSPALAVLVEIVEVVQTESAVPEPIVYTRGGGGGGGLFVADAGGFVPVAGLEPVIAGFDDVPVPDAPGFDAEAGAPVLGLAGKLEASAPGEGDCCAGSGVGLAVVATLFGDGFCEEQADCASNRTAIKPDNKKIFPNREFIKTLPSFAGFSSPAS
jgi:hypothetical protein